MPSFKNPLVIVYITSPFDPLLRLLQSSNNDLEQHSSFVDRQHDLLRSDSIGLLSMLIRLGQDCGE